MVNEMSLRLEKLVEDIKEETILWPIEDAKNSPEEDAAWARIGAKHRMTGPHVKSIFKVLSKKYEVEKANPKSEWKLFSYLSFLDKKKENVDTDLELDVDDGEEFVELLEVKDEYCSDDEEPNTSGGSNSENSSKNISASKATFIPSNIQIKKIRNDKSYTLERNDLNGTVKKFLQNSSENGVKTNVSIISQQMKNSEQDITKSASPVPRKVARISMTTSKANNVNAPERKTQSTLTAGLKLGVKKDDKQKILTSNLKEIKLKRKVETKSYSKEDDELTSPPIKKQIILPKGIKVIPNATKSSTTKSSSTLNESQQQNLTNDSANLSPSSAEKLPPFSSILKKSPDNKLNQQVKDQYLKQDQDEKQCKTPQHVLKSIKKEVISPTQQSNLSSISNNKINNCELLRKEFTDKNEAKLEIEQISKDAHENTEIKVKVLTEQAEKILPTFFRDLYNSKKYDSFGMYVSSTMNRLPVHLASKLEAKILQSIIEVNALVDDDIENM